MRNNEPKNNQEQLKEALQNQANENLPDLWARIEARLPETESEVKPARKRIPFGLWAKRLSATAAVVLAVVVGFSVYRSNIEHSSDAAPPRDEFIPSTEITEDASYTGSATKPDSLEAPDSHKKPLAEKDEPAHDKNQVESILPNESQEGPDKYGTIAGDASSDLRFLFEFQDENGQRHIYNSFEHTHEVYEGELMTDSGWTADNNCLDAIKALLDTRKVWETESYEGSGVHFQKTDAPENTQDELTLWVPTDRSKVGFHLYLAEDGKVLNLYAIASPFASDSMSHMICELYDGLREACSE